MARTNRQTSRVRGPEAGFGHFDGSAIEGPATIALEETTILVPEGWTAKPVPAGLVELARA